MRFKAAVQLQVGAQGRLSGEGALKGENWREKLDLAERGACCLPAAARWWNACSRFLPVAAVAAKVGAKSSIRPCACNRGRCGPGLCASERLQNWCCGRVTLCLVRYDVWQDMTADAPKGPQTGCRQTCDHTIDSTSRRDDAPRRDGNDRGDGGPPPGQERCQRGRTPLSRSWPAVCGCLVPSSPRAPSPSCHLPV
jgi:hypothetical protein